MIDGRQAVLIWPTTANGDLTSPSDCHVHLAPAGRLTDDFAFPCAEWFLPPSSGSFDLWVEQGDLISAYQTSMRYIEGKGATSGARATEVLGPAGYVRSKAPVANDETLRLLSLTSPSFGFERRLNSNAARERVRVPAGQVLAGIFTSAGDAIALTRPTTVKHGETVLLDPARPTKGVADLVLVVKRASGGEPMPRDLTVSLTQGASARAPDVLRIAQTRLFAVWYALPPTGGTISVQGEKMAVALAAGEVTTIRGQLGSLRK